MGVKSFNISDISGRLVLVVVTFLFIISPVLTILNPQIALATPVITEYPLPPNLNSPRDIVSAPDGALWFTNGTSLNTIGRISTSGSVTYYQIPQPATIVGLAVGTDGALWFTNTVSCDASYIGRMTTSGSFTEYQVPTGCPNFISIAASPDGSLWFTEYGNSQTAKIGHITTDGIVTEYIVGSVSNGDGITGIAVGADGNIWFTDYLAGKIGKIPPSGGYPILYTIPAANPYPSDIISGPDGALWFTNSESNSIGRITTNGSITLFPLSTPSAEPSKITSGPDGALWFTEASANRIGRITTSGSITDFPIPTAGSTPADITSGPDGALWFTEYSANKIGRLDINPAPAAPTGLAATSPTQDPALTWNAMSGVSGYNIYRDGSLIGTTTASSYLDAVAAEGIDTYYVTAVNNAGESLPSNSVNVLVDRTAPILGTPIWASNPVTMGSNTSFTVPAADSTAVTTDVSGVAGGEYFVGTDPGVGQATPLGWDGTNLASGSFGANLAAGVYNVGIRARDAAGNWSPTMTAYLVVFNPAGPGYIVGQHNLTPTSSAVLPWISTSPRDFATFGFNVKFTSTGTVDPASSFNFNYDEKGNCGTPNAPACHTFDLVANSFDWLGIGGTDNSQGVFQGTGTLTINGVSQAVIFRVDAVDGDQLTPKQSDSFVLKVYGQGSDPQTSTPLYQVGADFTPGSGNANGGVQVKG